ncbi:MULTISPECIES: HAAS signaling domain-containing protein [Bacillaceae]|uniref:DUF1700 domain-containing protein n=1 Tax=Evansella alkalicola TaxID=745819 RepID=A0ABS6JUI2_9BACI|nr:MULTISPECIES: DUF1700 domain-containing protein [Bacillaceae]MBU9720897.1 DUF1700 domain-containing protein [Bacillus alkalicola]
MTRQQFLEELREVLSMLPNKEREEIMADFEEHFENGLEAGKREDEICEALGKPQQIGKELAASYHLERAETTVSPGNIFRAVWAIIGLGFFNLVIVLGPFIAVLGIIFAGWVTGLAFTVSPVLLIFNYIISPDAFLLFEFFFSLILSGVGIFLSIAMYFVTRFIINGFIKYLSYNMRLVKGGFKNA